MMRKDGGKRPLQQLVEYGFTELAIIQFKIEILESCEANLTLRQRNSAKERAEYKQSVWTCQ